MSTVQLLTLTAGPPWLKHVEPARFCFLTLPFSTPTPRGLWVWRWVEDCPADYRAAFPALAACDFHGWPMFESAAQRPEVPLVRTAQREVLLRHQS